MNNIIVKDEVMIENLIYEVRGKQVMLDSDLAKLYECKNGTKEINQAVNRHLDRFPEDFCFQLNESEYHSLRSQFVTLKGKRGAHRKYLPHVFTEEGAAMLSSVLSTSIASQVSVKIMRAFVNMRKYGFSTSLEQNFINNLVLEDHEKIKLLENIFQRLEEKRKINEIYFNGQIFDAYSKIQDIFKNANNKLIIIDAYADNTLLDIIKKLNVKVVIITKSNNLLTNQDILKYNGQYNNLKVIFNNDFHDRYFIIDENDIYHCGTSINRIGYKTFSINLINDSDVCTSLINKVKNIIH